MKCQQHTDCKPPFHNEGRAQQDHRHVGQSGQQCGQNPKGTAQFCETHLCTVHAGVQSAPALKKTIFRAAGLDSFNHFNA